MKKHIRLKKGISALTVLALAVCATVCGCSSSSGGGNAKLSSSTMPDFQYMYKLMGAAGVPTQKSDNGYYNVVGNRVVFTDAETLKTTPLCSKSDCLHTSEFPDCNATIGNGINASDNFQIYKDNIYTFSFEYDEDDEDFYYQFNRISLDGTQKDVLLEIRSKTIVDWFLYDGYLYYQVSVDVNEAEQSSGNFYRMSLDDKKEELFIDVSKLDGVYGAELSMRNVYDGSIIFTVYGYTSEEDYQTVISSDDEISGEIEYVVKISSYDMESGMFNDINPFGDDFEFVGIANGKIVGWHLDSNDKKTACICDLDGKGGKNIAAVSEGSTVLCDDNYVYVCDAQSRELAVYNYEGKLKSKVLLPSELIEYISIVSFGDNDYLWFQKQSTDNDPKTRLCCIKKSDLLKNDGKEAAYETLYETE